MFESMILDDVSNGEGVGVIDPHGDLIEKLLRKIPKERADDVIILDPGDMERPVGFNILEYEDEAQKEFLIQELLAIIERLMREYDPSFAGPIFHLHSKMVLKLIMSDPQKMGTLVQFYNVFSSQDYFNRFLPLPKPDRLLEAFVDGTLKNTNYTKVSNDGGSMGSWIASKYEPFVGSPMLRNIFGQQRSTIDLRKIMDKGKILFINLSKGRMGEMNSRFFGMVLIAKLQAAAMSRASIEKKDRRDFYLYVDEFQNLANQNFSVLLAEARKYRLNLILTNQFVTQVPTEIMQAITGNVGSLISFRVGSLDAEFLERDFAPYFNRFDLMNLPNFHTYVSTLVDGEVSKPFSMRIISDLAEGDEKMSKEIRSQSRAKYGAQRELIEQMIDADLAPQKSNEADAEVEGGVKLSMKARKALDQEIDDLELSLRTFSGLKKSGDRTLREIVKFTRNEWKEKCPNWSTKSLNELGEVLATNDLEFGM